jgi:hypothetical protein
MYFRILGFRFILLWLAIVFNCFHIIIEFSYTECFYMWFSHKKNTVTPSGSICMSVICSPNKYIIHDITDEILIGTINTNNSPSMQGNYNRCGFIEQITNIQMEPLAFVRCLETFTIEVDVGNWILVSDITFGAKSMQSYPTCSMYFRILGFRFILLWLAHSRKCLLI